MANTEMITKRVAISKANAQMVIIVGVAAFITVFCLIASKSILSKNEYQGRVISAEDKANSQLTSNLEAFNTLNKNYQSFISDPTNVIGGQSSGNANNSGSNSKIVLDALPPTYDFPALASSIEAILSGQHLTIGGISGLDEELSEENNNISPDPTPVAMAFTFTVNNVSYQQIGSLLQDLQKSIRPIAIDNVSLNGGGSNIILSVSAHTYYQPGKSLGISEVPVQ